MIRSMPANRKFRDNYDRIFQRSNAVVAQRVEQLLDKQQAEGAIHSNSTKIIIKCQDEDIVLNGS